LAFVEDMDSGQSASIGDGRYVFERRVGVGGCGAVYLAYDTVLNRWVAIKQIETAEVQLGTSNKVGLVAPSDLSATVPAGTAGEMRLTVSYDGPIKAPIKAGQHIADLVVVTPGMPAERLPLVAANDVPQAGFFGRAWAGLMSLFGA
jgi:D-alanyl-D-alanine carboxypeptidase